MDVFDVENLDLGICDSGHATSHDVVAARFQFDRVSVEECFHWFRFPKRLSGSHVIIS